MLVLPPSMFFHQYVKEKMGKIYLILEILKDNIFMWKKLFKKTTGILYANKARNIIF